MGGLRPDREPSKPSKNENREEQACLEEKSQAGTSGPHRTGTSRTLNSSINPTGQEPNIIIIIIIIIIIK